MYGELLRVATTGLRQNKLRSVLTISTVALGTLAIVFMSSLSQSGLATLVRRLEDLGGARMMVLTPKSVETEVVKAAMYGVGFTNADRVALTERLPHVVQSSVYHQEKLHVASDSGRERELDVVGADERFLDLVNMKLAYGRALSKMDGDARASVCLIGPTTSKDLFDDSPIGRMLTVGHGRCRVVGVLADNARFGIQLGFDWNDLVVMPYATLLGDRELDSSCVIILRTDDPRHNDAVARFATAILSERHHGIDDFAVWDFAKILEKLGTTFLIMQLLVGGLSAVALVIGGVGVMNMMLVSVSERVKEIGIRKALGAAPADIRFQFVAEATMLSLIGGGLGIALGGLLSVVASSIIEHFVPIWVSGVSHVAVLGSFAMVLLIGVVFGYFPAQRAARLDAVTAIRA